jgi:hypothetical protein
MKTLKILAVASIAFGAIFATVPYAQAADSITAADQHAAMAQHHQAKAAAASEKAAAHEVMARTGGSPKANTQAMANHCEALIAQYRAEAAAHSAKAAEHGQLAGTASVARTTEQHLASARQLEAKATAANAKVAEHEAMARAGGSPKSDGRSMNSHCESLIAHYRSDAESYAAQAAEHTRLATTK